MKNSWKTVTQRMFMLVGIAYTAETVALVLRRVLPAMGGTLPSFGVFAIVYMVLFAYLLD